MPSPYTTNKGESHSTQNNHLLHHSILHLNMEMSNTRAEPSVETETKALPSAVVASDCTTSAWPLNSLMRSPERLSQMRTLPSMHPDATYLDEPSHASDVTPSCENSCADECTEWMNEWSQVHPEAKKKRKTATRQITHVMFANAAVWLMCEVPDDKLLIHAPGSRPAVSAGKKGHNLQQNSVAHC